jgi:hypothetical protein
MGQGPAGVAVEPAAYSISISKQQKYFVIPAQAGIHWALVIAGRWIHRMDSRLRGNDEIMGSCA